MFREKASTIVIYVLSREVLAKHIELEFMNLDQMFGDEMLAHYQEKVCHDVYLCKVLKESSYFNTLTMRSVEPHINIEPWSPNGGIKGDLQQGWFRVTNLSADKDL